MEIKLSIIIPVYNAEKYLQRCVESCLEQGLQSEEQEILLCNDGSTDGSLELAKSLAARDNRIKVFSQENAGTGMARNLGLRHATGRYVMFVDSDDYLCHNTLLPLLELCDNYNLDVCNYLMGWSFLDNGEHHNGQPSFKSTRLYNGEELLCNSTFILGSVCTSLFRRHLLSSYHIDFMGQTSSEDVAFNLLVYIYAQRIMFSNVQVYNYEIRTGSRRHSKDIDSRIRYIKNNLRNAAHIKSVVNSTTHLLTSTKRSLICRSNSMVVGCLIELWKNKKIIIRNNASNILEYANNLNVYPICGHTFSYKTTLLAHLVFNNKKIFLFCFVRC